MGGSCLGFTHADCIAVLVPLFEFKIGVTLNFRARGLGFKSLSAHSRHGFKYNLR